MLLIKSSYCIRPIEDKQQRKRTQICIKCNRRGIFGERKRKRERERKRQFWDIIHGLPIIHSKDLDSDRQIEKKREGEGEREKEREGEKEIVLGYYREKSVT